MTTYLYGRGRHRHIRDEGFQHVNRPLCGGPVGCTPEPIFFEWQRKWYTPKVAQRRIERFRSMPVCKHCLRVVTP